MAAVIAQLASLGRLTVTWSPAFNFIATTMVSSAPSFFSGCPQSESSSFLTALSSNSSHRMSDHTDRLHTHTQSHTLLRSTQESILSFTTYHPGQGQSVQCWGQVHARNNLRNSLGWLHAAAAAAQMLEEKEQRQVMRE